MRHVPVLAPVVLLCIATTTMNCVVTTSTYVTMHCIVVSTSYSHSTCTAYLYYQYYYMYRYGTVQYGTVLTAVTVVLYCDYVVGLLWSVPEPGRHCRWHG